MTPPGQLPWAVFVDDNFHYMDEDSRVTRGRFATLEEAVAACMEITRASLKECGEGWSQYGDDPWISPRPAAEELAALLEAHPDWPAAAFESGFFSARSYVQCLRRSGPEDHWTRGS